MFGARLAAERKRLGLNQTELGERWGIGRSAVAMVETDQAPLDAARLLAMGAAGADVLYVLTGEPGKVAAGKLLDWDLCLKLVETVAAFERRNKIRIPADKKAIMIKHLYLKLAQSPAAASTELEEIMRMAA